jgi:hypothetical protein
MFTRAPTALRSCSAASGVTQRVNTAPQGQVSTAAPATSPGGTAGAVGPTVCSGIPLSCSPTGNGFGVRAANVDNVTVVNGAIGGMGNSAVFLGGFNRVDRVHAISNGLHGVIAGFVATLTGSKAIDNGGQGFSLGSGSVVTGNTARGNGTFGIFAGPGSTVSGNTALQNGSSGILTSSGSIVIGNATISNTSFGLRLGSPGAGYSQNAVSGNNGGDANLQVSGRINGGQNVCDTDAVCP